MTRITAALLSSLSLLLVGCATPHPTQHLTSFSPTKSTGPAPAKTKAKTTSKWITVAWQPYHNDFRWSLQRHGYGNTNRWFQQLGCSSLDRPPCWIREGRGGSIGTAFQDETVPNDGPSLWTSLFRFELMDWKKDTDVEIKLTVGEETWFHARSLGRKKISEWEIYSKDVRVSFESDQTFRFSPFAERPQRAKRARR